MTTFHLFDSLTQRSVSPSLSQHVSIYACGITPYSDAHVGHARSYVIFDALSDVLRAAGHTVRLVRNITDIDDKIIAAAQREGISWHALSERYASDNRTLMRRTKLSVPEEPKASEYLPEIFSIIERLMGLGLAYESGGDVLYRVQRYQGQALMHHRAHALRSEQGHARVDTDHKEDPRDFTLWKSVPVDADGFHSPWGYGRPGWHIECSAMIGKLFGGHVDIHGGGVDLKFPHHDSEIMQSEPVYQTPLAKVWMHHGSVLSNGVKMSKSLGNFVTWSQALDWAQELVPGRGGDVLKIAMLSATWSKPLDWNRTLLEKAAHTYLQMRSAVQHSGDVEEEPFRQQVVLLLTRNFNTSLVWAAFHALKTPSERGGMAKAIAGLWSLDLTQETVVYPEEVQQWLREREEARRVKDYSRSDALRALIVAAGYAVQDR